MFNRLTCLLASFAIAATVAAYQNGHNQNEQETLELGSKVLWVEPGDPSSFDFRYGIGGSEGQPQPPFRFAGEDRSGTSPKINVTDSRGVEWNVKWGHEARPSTFCTRLVSACGYVVESEYFLANGRVEGAHGLKRAKSHISDDGSFVNARFQVRSGSRKYLADHGWAWTDNPFLGTHELQGLKILMLLLSNWDAKDSRDRANGPNGSHMDSNLGIFEDDSTGERRYLYADSDWGASLGRWGNMLTWTKWDCRGFADQTRDFVKRGENGSLQWGFKGKHNKDLTDDISVADVQWLLQYLGKITDEQIRQGLAASGATPAERDCYTHALRLRIDKLQQAVNEVLPQNN